MAERVAGPSRRPTIHDVAERAGVSKSLVSLVMRGEPFVREDKRRRVQRAAEELGYRTNWAARSLSAVRSGAVGVLVADLRNPWSMDVVEAASQVLEEAGLTTLLTSAVLPSSTDGERRLDAGVIGALKDLRVDGLLVVGSVPDRARLADLVGDLPAVVVGARAEGLARADVVRSDDAAGMGLVVDHLVERGHRRIAHLGGAGGAVADERAAGYRSTMTRHDSRSKKRGRSPISSRSSSSKLASAASRRLAEAASDDERRVLVIAEAGGANLPSAYVTVRKGRDGWTAVS